MLKAGASPSTATASSNFADWVEQLKRVRFQCANSRKETFGFRPNSCRGDYAFDWGL